MGLEIARSVLETGGDVICVDHADEPLQDGWCKQLIDTEIVVHRATVTDSGFIQL